MVIDTEYTKLIRARAATGEVFSYSIYTEEEINYLLDFGASDQTGYTTRLAEAAIERTTGLRVNLSAEAPAQTCVVREGESVNKAEGNTAIEEEGLTFTVNYDKTRHPGDSEITHDRATVPKVTPQDETLALASLNYPSPSIAAHQITLDGLRLDSNENPFEQAFLTQVAIAKVLKSWGVDIKALCSAIDSEWGISYTHRLVTEVSLTKVRNVETYIANGSRQSPEIYMSPTILSRYTVEQSLARHQGNCGYSGVQIERAEMIGKFIMATKYQIGGNGCMDSAIYRQNPSHAVAFDPNSLQGRSMTVDKLPDRTTFADFIPGLESFDSFIACRQMEQVEDRKKSHKEYEAQMNSVCDDKRNPINDDSNI
jgi:hypothetical protein